ncbi:hypothetical protein IFR05_008249 [Cadophora sp. M221]|nr:hypothetical protein IFR05_008249 [Cadophora sp. M221]
MSQYEVNTNMTEREESPPGDTIAVKTYEERIAEIPEHPAIKARKQSLKITLDFASGELAHLEFWQSESYATFQTALLSALALYNGISIKVFISLIFPHHSLPTQRGHVRQLQMEMVRRVAELVDQFHGIRKIDVVFQSPETGLRQILTLACLYHLNFKRWRAFIKEGDNIARRLIYSDKWARPLASISPDWPES